MYFKTRQFIDYNNSLLVADVNYNMKELELVFIRAPGLNCRQLQYNAFRSDTEKQKFWLDCRYYFILDGYFV